MARSTLPPRISSLCFRGIEYVVASQEVRPEEALGQLTASEAEVLSELLRGKSYAQIAIARKRSRRTIANQVASILQKLEVRSRRELWLGSARRSVESPRQKRVRKPRARAAES